MPCGSPTQHTPHSLPALSNPHPHPSNTPPHTHTPHTHRPCRGLHDYDPDYQLAKERAAMWEEEWYEGDSHHAAPEEKQQEQYKR